MREYFQAPELDYVDPDTDTADRLIADGVTQYKTVSSHLLREHVGSTDEYLSHQASFELAQLIQAGHLAVATLEGIPDATTVADKRYLADLRAQASAGITARNKLVECNLRFASYYARASMGIVTKKRRDNGSDAGDEYKPEFVGTFGDITKLKSHFGRLDDRIQVANLALIKAADKFQPRLKKNGQPVNFLAFAAWDIQNELHRYVTHDEQIGLALSWDMSAIAHSNIDDPRNDPAKIQAARNMREAVSLELIQTDRYAPEESEHDTEQVQLAVSDLLVSDPLIPSIDQLVARERLRDQIDTMVETTLSEREAEIIALRLGLGDDVERSLSEVGQIKGLSPERIRQIETKTIAKLRHPSRSEVLRDYLEPDSGTLTLENNLWGSNFTPAAPYMAQLAVRVALEGEVSDVPARRTRLSPSTHLPGDWRTTEAEDWETPLRKSQAELEEIIAETGKAFEQIMWTTKEGPFSRMVNSPVPYPAELVADIQERCGVYLRAQHIEQFFNDSLESYLEAQVANGYSVDMTRLSNFFSHVLTETMTDSDTVTLRIPDQLDGKLDRFGHGLKHGTLLVQGNLGDYAGYEMGGLGTMIVEGSVGDYAAHSMDGLASLNVRGNAGQFVGYGAADGTILVWGRSKSLALRPTFAGDLITGSYGRAYIGTPMDHISIEPRIGYGRL